MLITYIATLAQRPFFAGAGAGSLSLFSGAVSGQPENSAGTIISVALPSSSRLFRNMTCFKRHQLAREIVCIVGGWVVPYFVWGYVVFFSRRSVSNKAQTVTGHGSGSPEFIWCSMVWHLGWHCTAAFFEGAGKPTIT